jgi:hypothetical protein
METQSRVNRNDSRAVHLIRTQPTETNVMYFYDLMEPGQDCAEYEKLLSDLSKFVGDCVRYLIDAFNVANVKAAKEQCSSHTTVLMLVRHIIEAIDGVSVLVREGCAENCGPLLRSAFEGQLGVLYILQADRTARGLAYQVAHAHRRIKMYKKFDPNDALAWIPTGGKIG